VTLDIPHTASAYLTARDYPKPYVLALPAYSAQYLLNLGQSEPLAGNLSIIEGMGRQTRV
jgi:hypothetical protein